MLLFVGVGTSDGMNFLVSKYRSWRFEDINFTAPKVCHDLKHVKGARAGGGLQEI
jgi:hypothetical protein